MSLRKLGLLFLGDCRPGTDEEGAPLERHQSQDRGRPHPGEKGTAKSTAVRALANLLPQMEVVANCPFGCSPHDSVVMCSNCLEVYERGDTFPGRDAYGKSGYPSGGCYGGSGRGDPRPGACDQEGGQKVRARGPGRGEFGGSSMWTR